MLFYCQTAAGCIWGETLREVADKVRAIQPLVYDVDFLNDMLTWGYSPDAHTVYQGIRRIQAGEQLVIDEHGQGRVERYHRFDNTPNNLTLDENIERLDLLFRQAVKRITDRNHADGKVNYMPLSAGLDSRMTVRVAHDMTTDPVVNITYSQSGYYDEVVPREIAAYLGNKWLFRALDGGDCLTRIDEVVSRCHGLVNYSSQAELIDSFDSLPRETIGVIGTGMVGDVILSSHFAPGQEEQELQFYYQREFNYIMLGSPLIQKQLGDSVSPFMDIDFMTFCLTIPIAQRRHHRIYDEWILRKYPDMAQWAHNGTELIGHRRRKVNIMGRELLLREVPKRMCLHLLKRLGIYDGYKMRENESMNPEDSWYETNSNLREVWDTYFADHISLVDFDPKLQSRMCREYAKGAAEKENVLTALAAIQNFKL